MQPWHRWREPLAVVLLVALGLVLVLRGIGIARAIAAGDPVGYSGAIPGGDDLLLLAAAAAVVWCVLPLRATGSEGEPPGPSPSARPIALVAVSLLGLIGLARVLLAGADVVVFLRRSGPDPGVALMVAEELVRLVVPGIALAAAVVAVRRLAASRVADAGPAALPPTAPDTSAPPPDPPRLPATWQADEATGAVWLTADDAAQGQPGLSWSNPASAGALTGGSWAEAPAAPVPTATEDPAGSPWGEPPVRADERARSARPARAAEDDDLR